MEFEGSLQTQTSGKLISLPAAGLTKLQPAAGSLGASMTTNVSVSANHMSLTSTQQKNMQANSVPDSDIQVITKQRLQDLVREIDPTEQLDDDVEDVLLQLADDFVESTVTAACLLAKHRKSNTVEVKDVQLHLEKYWNLWQPGFGMDELRTYKRTPVSEAHKQRLALIRKTIKKY